MYTRFRAWCGRRTERHVAYLEGVQRMGVAKYSLRWGLIAAVFLLAVLLFDSYQDNCCSRSLLELVGFASVLGLLFGVLCFVLTYINVRFELWLFRRRAP